MSAKLFLLVVGSLLFLLAGSTSASDEVINLRPIDVSRLILSKKPQNLIFPRAESTSTVSPSPRATTPSYSDCGVANDAITKGKIIGGNETAPNEFPWQAVLQVVKILNDKTTSSEFCGGSLIADRWILTSASCLQMSEKQELVVVYVYLGGHNISAASEVNRKDYWGNETFFHADWNTTTQGGDIALLKLSTVVQYTQYIRPICLPSSSEPDYIDKTVVVSGVGLKTAGGDISDPPSLLIHKMTVSVIKNSECNVSYNNLITDRMICTGAVLYGGVCEMDKGNPLMLKQTDGTYKQIGLISLTPMTSSPCQIGIPLVYTRLSSYSSWIEKMTSPTTTPTPISTTTPSPSSATTSASTLSSLLFPFVSFVIFMAKM